MAGRKAGSPSRSEFIRKFLDAKTDGKLADVNEAWKKSGHSGEITATLFYQVKSKSGQVRSTGRRGRPPKAASNGNHSVKASGGSLELLRAASSFVSVAGSVDNAIATLEALRSFGK